MHVRQRGVTLLLAVLFLTVGLSIALSIFYIVYVQLQINRSARDSHIAFFSADAGKECALYYFQNYQDPTTSVTDDDPTLGGFWNPKNPCLDGNCAQDIRCANKNDNNVDVELVVENSDPNAEEPRAKFHFKLDDTSRNIYTDVYVTTEYKLFSSQSDQKYIKFVVESVGKSSFTQADPVNRTLRLCYSSRNKEDCIQEKP